MIDIKQHILALQFNGVVRLFDNNYTSAWKTLPVLDKKHIFLYTAF